MKHRLAYHVAMINETIRSDSYVPNTSPVSHFPSLNIGSSASNLTDKSAFKKSESNISSNEKDEAAVLFIKDRIFCMNDELNKQPASTRMLLERVYKMLRDSPEGPQVSKPAFKST